MLKLDLYVYFSQKSVHRRDSDKTKYMSFFIKEDELFEKYNEIWVKFKNSIWKEFHSKPVYNEKYLTANI